MPGRAVAAEPYSEGRAGDAAVGSDVFSRPDSPNAVLSGGKNQKIFFCLSRFQVHREPDAAPQLQSRHVGRDMHPR
jgi:hypothetical protein